MIIEKDERNFTVVELLKEWKVTCKIGSVGVEYRIPKEVAQDAEAVREYIGTSDLF